MKNILSLLCAATIVTAPCTTLVHAENITTKPVTTTTVTTTAPSATVQLDKLTLENVLQAGLSNNKNLTVLQHNLQAANYQLLNAKGDLAETQSDIRRLNSKVKALNNNSRELEFEERLEIDRERIAMKTSIQNLEEQAKKLELQLKNFESTKQQLQLQVDETKAAIKLLLTSGYTNVVMLQKQIATMKKTITEAQAEIKKAERLLAVGMGSKEAVRLAKVAEKNSKKTMTDLEKQYTYQLTKLCLDAGITYLPNLIIEPVQHTPTAVETPADFTALIDNAFKIQKAQKNVDIAQANRAELYRSDATNFNISNDELQQSEYVVKAAQETINATKNDLQKTIEQLYYNANQTLLTYEDAVRKQQDVQDDLKALKKRYELGLIPKRTYETASLQLEQATLQVEISKMQHFLALQSLDAAKTGYFQ